MPDVAVERRRVHVRGTVQGVGFRPQVYRVARELGLAGWVGNDAHGLVLEVEGPVPSNEGKLVAVVPLDQAESALAALRDHPLGAARLLSDRIASELQRIVLLETSFAGSRLVDMLVRDPLPRICRPLPKWAQPWFSASVTFPAQGAS